MKPDGVHESTIEHRGKYDNAQQMAFRRNGDGDLIHTGIGTYARKWQEGFLQLGPCAGGVQSKRSLFFTCAGCFGGSDARVTQMRIRYSPH
jgi:hypothetical protein